MNNDSLGSRVLLSAQGESHSSFAHTIGEGAIEVDPSIRRFVETSRACVVKATLKSINV
jgi:hypothetical protein